MNEKEHYDDAYMHTIQSAAKVMNVDRGELSRRIESGDFKTLPWGDTGKPRIPHWYLRVWQQQELEKVGAKVAQILNLETPTTKRSARAHG